MKRVFSQIKLSNVTSFFLLFLLCSCTKADEEALYYGLVSLACCFVYIILGITALIVWILSKFKKGATDHSKNNEFIGSDILDGDHLNNDNEIEEAYYNPPEDNVYWTTFYFCLGFPLVYWYYWVKVIFPESLAYSHSSIIPNYFAVALISYCLSVLFTIMIPESCMKVKRRLITSLRLAEIFEVLDNTSKYDKLLYLEESNQLYFKNKKGVQGEKMIVKSINHQPGLFELLLISQSTLRTTSFDFGRNKKNVEAFETFIRRLEEKKKAELL